MTDNEAAEITPDEEKEIDTHLRDQEFVIDRIAATPGIDAASVANAKAAVLLQQRLLHTVRKMRERAVALASDNLLLIEESKRSDAEKRELIEAFAKPAKTLTEIDIAEVDDNLAAHEAYDDLRAALDKLERSGLVL